MFIYIYIYIDIDSATIPRSSANAGGRIEAPQAAPSRPKTGPHRTKEPHQVEGLPCKGIRCFQMAA